MNFQDSSYARLQKIVQPTTSDSVDITSEDDDDVVGSNIENFKPSTSSNSEVSPLKKVIYIFQYLCVIATGHTNLWSIMI